MDLIEEVTAVYDESTQSLRTSNVGTAGAKARSTLSTERIQRNVFDEDAGVLRVVSA